MGVLSTLGKVFSSEKAIAKTVDAVSNGLDKLVYTEEEKADAASADRAAGRALVIGWMESTNGQNIARRVIAFMITGVWLMQYTIANLFSILAVFTLDDKRTLIYTTASAVMANYAVQMNGAVMLILAFYFAAPHMANIVEAAMSRFGTAPAMHQPSKVEGYK